MYKGWFKDKLSFIEWGDLGICPTRNYCPKCTKIKLYFDVITLFD